MDGLTILLKIMYTQGLALHIPGLSSYSNYFSLYKVKMGSKKEEVIETIQGYITY